MVDLVKIRKKAKKKEEEARAEAEAHPEPAAPPDASPASDVRVQRSQGSRRAAPSSDPPAASRPPAGDEHRATTPEHPTPETSTRLDRFKAEAGKRREIDRGSVAEETVTGQFELLTFVISGEQYAVDIEGIVEIVTPRPVTRIPNADASVVGIISLRGTIVTLVDVRRKLRHPAAGDADADTRLVVVDFHGELVGFVVDRVLRVVKTAAGEIEAHPVAHATELDESVRGVFRVSGALTILLDLDKLLDHRALAASTA